MNTIAKAQSKSHDAVDRTAAGMQSTLDAIADAAAPAIDKVAAGAHQAVDKLVNAAAPAAKWFEARAARLNKSRMRAIEGSKQCIQNHPFATIGAAIAVGALIAFIARSRAH